MRAWVPLAILGLLAGGAYAWHDWADDRGVLKPLARRGLEKAPPPAPRGGPAGGQVPVVVAAVRVGAVIERLESGGTVCAREAVIITAKVTAIRFTEGQRVREGDVLLQFDSAAIRAEIDEARAALGNARSRLACAQALSAGQAVAQARADELETLARANRVRAITIATSLAPGYSLGEALAFMDSVAREVLPPDARISYCGQSL